MYQLSYRPLLEPPAPGPFSKAMTTSLLLHGLVLTIIIVLGSQVVPPTPLPPIEVSLGTAPSPPADIPTPTPPTTKAPRPAPPKPQSRLRPLSSPSPSAAVLPPPVQAPREATGTDLPPLPGPPSDPAQAGASAPTNGGNPGQGGGSHSLPYVLDGPAPPYPQDARIAGREGKVRVKVLISEQGRVQEMLLVQSSGTPSLDEAALTALQGWRFHPAQRDGQPVAAWVIVPVVFSLR